MKFSKLAGFIEKIEDNTSRLVITRLLSELFSELDISDIKETVYLLQGRLTPLYEAVEFGMAEKMIIKGVILALNLEKKLFNDRYKKIGDLGKTVEDYKKEIKSFEEKDLTIGQVYEQLYKLAIASGEGSQETKINILANLIRQLDHLSCRYLVRIPLGAMRLGFSDMTVLDALSWFIKGDKSLRSVIEKAYHVRPDLGLVGQIIKQKGIMGLKGIKPNIFTPILMMKAERLSSGKEIIKKIGRCAIESKYDGFRLQIHYRKKDNLVKLYSRNLEEVSLMYPDVSEGVKNEAKVEEIIFEGEAIGFDPRSGAFLPFQETAQRKRKYGIEEKAKEIPLKLFAFDLLYLNGINYLDSPYTKRREKLSKAIQLTDDMSKNTILIAQENIADEEEKIEFYFDNAIANGLEGIIAKKLDGIYQPGARGWNWIKFKRSYSSKIQDTIDCLVMGYDLGRGKRADFGIGALLVGIYDKKEERFVTIAKIGTGLTDKEWQDIKKRGDRYKTDKKPPIYEVDKQMAVDIWIKPSIVIEIKADEITRSPVHTAGRKMGSTGFALRFPRLEKFRDDKRPEEVTTLKEVEEMFNGQGQNTSKIKK